MTLGSHQTSIGKTQVHIRPRWIIEVLGPFDLDPTAANPMLQRMEAVVLFYSPSDLDRGTAALVEHGFEVEVLDYIDDYGPTIWIKAKVASELDVHRFSDWVQALSSHCTAMLRKPVSLTRRRKLPDHTARAKDFAHGPA